MGWPTNELRPLSVRQIPSVRQPTQVCCLDSWPRQQSSTDPGVLGQEDVGLLSGDHKKDRTDGVHVSSFERKYKLSCLIGPNERTRTRA